jgi:RNA polymerase sigma factor (sigma-70 family)
MTQDPCWPTFLDLLDSDRETAIALFYKYAMLLLGARPPRLFSCMTDQEREDCLQEIIVHCIEQDLRVLRRYENRGRPFSAWLYTVAHHKAFEWWRRGRDGGRRRIDLDPEYGGHVLPVGGTPARPDERAAWEELLEVVRDEIGRMDDRCRLLLNLSADEYKVKEIVRALALPPDQNKKISDDLRYCRKKLKRRLADRGYDIGAFGLGPAPGARLDSEEKTGDMLRE